MWNRTVGMIGVWGVVLGMVSIGFAGEGPAHAVAKPFNSTADLQVVFKLFGTGNGEGGVRIDKLVCPLPALPGPRCHLTKEQDGQTVETIPVSKRTAEKLVNEFFKNFRAQTVENRVPASGDPVLMDYEVMLNEKSVKGSVHRSVLKGNAPLGLAPVLLLQAKLESRLLSLD